MTTETEQTRQSTIVSLQPQDVLLNKGITVSLPVRSATESDHLGLYFRSRYGWIFQTANMDSARGTMSTTLTRMLGELTIMKDDVPPSFSRVHVQARKGALSVAFRYFDNLSGVDPDEIKLYVDGSLRIPELDGEHRKAYYQGDEPLSRGKHSLRIVMKDRMKNTAEITRVLSVR